MKKIQYYSFDELPPIITIRDLMSVLNIGRNTAYKFVHSGAVRSLRIGRQIRIPKSEIIKLFNDFSVRDNMPDAEPCQEVTTADIERWLTVFRNTDQMKEIMR